MAILQVDRWAVVERRNGRLEHLAFPRPGAGEGDPCAPLLFSTRRAAKSYINARWGWRAVQPECPEGWQMPVPRRVEIIIRG